MRLRTFFGTYWLFLVVFITGASVLIVEITAVRILSTYFGNTIYTVSGVIGIILAALSVGYARGGVLADRKPTRKAFFSTIEQAGIALLVLFVLMLSVTPALSLVLPLSWGPFAVSLVLFFVPSYCLGKLSPFAIKLGEQERPHVGTGTISGQVFFWSTCGSLVGTLATAFVFIPQFGLNAIIFGTTLTVLLLGSCGKIVSDTRERRTQHVILLLFLLVALCFTLYSSARGQPGVLFMQDGVYQRLTIQDGTFAGRPARFFLHDRSVDDLRFLDSDELAAEYTKYYALYKIFTPNIQNALFIGGGMYTMPAALHRDAPDSHIDIAEIEPSLFVLAQEYFGVPNDPHLVNHIADGRRFMQDSTKTYELIFSDVYYSLYSVPPAFTTKEFFMEARKKLSPGGIFVANFIGSLSPDTPSLILSEIRTLKEVFSEVYVFATKSPTVPNDQNIIVVGVNSDAPASAERFEGAIPLPLPPNLRSMLVPLERYNLNEHFILTDNYAPVEYMTAQLLSSHFPVVLGTPDTNEWDGARAFGDIQTQLSFGVRALGTSGHQKEIDFIKRSLAKTDAVVQVQGGEYHTIDGETKPLTNILARFDPENPRRMVIGTHYDSIIRAYADKEHPDAPMPGANNGASGVALLLETARVLSSIPPPPVGIDIVFFDGEEGPEALGAGDPNWRALGSPLFVKELGSLYLSKGYRYPEQAVIVDMVCDTDLKLLPEPISLASAKSHVERFWSIGATVAPAVFAESPLAPSIEDDHVAFAEAGIPSFLVIDFAYAPWFNTTEDTLDKCSPQSLEAVGRTLLQYLYTE